MVLAYTSGLMEKSMMGSGRQGLDKARVFGKAIRELMFILETGSKIEQKDMEPTLGQMVNSIYFNNFR